MGVLTVYGVGGCIRLIVDKVRTVFVHSQSRIIRFPFEIRNKRYIKIGKGFTTGRYCRLEAHPVSKGIQICIEIGDNVQINDSVHIVGCQSVSIGDNALLASKIFISDSNHGGYGTNGVHDSPLSIPKDRPLICKPVKIEENVWLGEFVSVLPGVTIGKGSIIGTMSVVTKSIPPYSIAVGSPAKVVKKYNFETERWERTTG